MNQVAMAELAYLRNNLQTMEERLQAVEIERDEWKERAENLATNFLSVMKDLKQDLYEVKKDQKSHMKRAKKELEEDIFKGFLKWEMN